ncbi:tetratricopeptide repeat protein [Bradyrhizobium sp. F1.4.3]|uniref:tetratricopeptide repeat protein n=1 Tax=Bradyrhizobium sp. F1.4.3 TaxID=3156356 RepID=UPI00339A9374
MRDFGLAEQVAAKILKSNRAERNAVLILAHALLGQGRSEETIAPLERAARRGNDPEIEMLLGHSLCGSGRVVEGIEWLRRTSARRPPYVPAFQELAGQLAKIGQLDDAIKIIESGIALSPATIELRVDLGRLCLEGNERAKALAALMVARDAAPGRLDVLSELARALLLDGRFADSAESYRQVLALRPDDTLSRTNLAICLMEMGERAGGEAALRSVLRGRPAMLGRAAFALASASHGRFFFRPSAAAKFLE